MMTGQSIDNYKILAPDNFRHHTLKETGNYRDQKLSEATTK